MTSAETWLNLRYFANGAMGWLCGDDGLVPACPEPAEGACGEFVEPVSAWVGGAGEFACGEPAGGEGVGVGTGLAWASQLA